MILATALFVVQAWVTDPWASNRLLVHDDSVVHQNGSSTDAAAEVLQSLPKAERDALLKEFFDPVAGLGLSEETLWP